MELPYKGNLRKKRKDSRPVAPTGLTHSEPKPGGGKQPEPSPRAECHSSGDKAPTTKTLLGEIRIFDVINSFATVGMLAVAYATYRVASDTGEIKSAVQNLSSLASETKRQADNSQSQAIIMQQQLSELALERRAWIAASEAELA